MPTTNGPDPFPPVTYAQWRAGVESESGPDAVSRRLRSITEDGIGIEPLYAPGGPGTAESLAGRVATLRPGDANLRIRQRFALDVKPKVIRTALESGLRSLEFTGTITEELLNHLVRGLDKIPSHLWPTEAELSFDELNWGGWGLGNSGERRTSTGTDPIGHWLRAGGSLERGRDGLAAHPAIRRLADAGHTLFRATGEHFFDAGATTATTLGATMAVALEYLRAMERSAHDEIRHLEKAIAGYPGPKEKTVHWAKTVEAGVDMAWAASTMEVRLPCGPRFFESVAMLRAARLIWARLLELSGIPHSPLTVVASTGRRTLTLQDPSNNALRNTAVAFAAAIGGADVLQLLPHDIRSGEPSAAALRLARTTGLILEEEASLGRVMDPAQGSWFLESLTADLAAAAWEEMRRIDAEGGIIASIESGALGRRIADQASARHQRVRDGSHPILGVTDHPVAGETVTRSKADVADSDASRMFPLRPDSAPVEAA